MKLTEAVELFYKINRPPLVSQRTAETHRDTLGANFLPFLDRNYGELMLEEVTKDHIRAFQEHLLTRKRKSPGRKHSSILQSESAKERNQKGLLSLWTVKHHMTTVFRLFNWLVSEGEMDPRQSPILGLSMVNPGTTAAGSIPKEAILKMMQVASGPPLMGLYRLRDKAIEALMFMEGPAGEQVGSGELSRLRLADVEGGRLSLRTRSFELRCDLVGYDVELRAGQMAALESWLQVRPECCETPFVFVNMNERGRGGHGSPMTRKLIARVCRRELKRRKRPTSGPLSVHQLRDRALAALIGTKWPENDFVCQAGELSRLRMEDIEGGRLYLRSYSRRPEETAFEVVLSAEKEAALDRWLQVRPAGHESDHVFISLDPRGEEGAGGAMSNRAIYSAYFKEKNLTVSERLTRKKVIEESAVFAARRLALLLFFLDTGCRLGGVLGLSFDRLDLQGRRAVVLEKGRGGQKARTVFFSEVTAGALGRWIDLNDRPGDKIFPISRKNVRLAFDKLAEQAGVVDAPVNPHAFRHSFARFAIEAGADLSQVMRFLGHSSINVTAAFYIHWDVETLHEVHRKVSPVANLAQRRPKTGAAGNGLVDRMC